MPTPRRAQVSLSSTSYYHCISRCVRRAFLCGEDSYSGRSFEHRKSWVLERLGFLSEVFAIDVCAYAVMSNHVHLVLRVDEARARGMSEEEVLRRYVKLFGGASGQPQSLSSSSEQRALVSVWRSRLMDLSWMMRSLNEWLARRANREDGCKGRFWEGRFKSQALLDEAGLLTCMAYVDLNPVRAGVSSSLEGSEFASISARLRAADAVERAGRRGRSVVLMPMQGEGGAVGAASLPMSLLDYVALVEWTGRQVRSKARGVLEGPAPRLLTRLGLSAEGWSGAMQAHAVSAPSVLGLADAVAAEATRRGKAWLKGSAIARRIAT